MTQNLIFLENEDQVRHCLNWYDGLKVNKKIIALSPFAMYELDKRKIQYHIPEEYYNSDELYKMGVKNFKRVENFCNIIDKKIHENLPQVQSLQITPAFFEFFSLKEIYDACTIRLFQLSKIFEKEKPENIYFYNTKKYPCGEYNRSKPLLYDNKESLYTHLLKLYEKNYHFEIQPAFSQDKYYTSDESVKQHIIKWIESQDILFNSIIKIRILIHKKFHPSTENILPVNKKISAMLVGGTYNWNESKLSEMGIAPIYKIQNDVISKINSLSHKIDSHKIKQIWDRLRNDKNFLEFFIWDTIDFFPVIEDRFKFLMENIIEVDVQTYEEIREFIRKKDIKIVLGASFSSCIEQTIGQTSKDLNIPVILWQHGCYGYFDWIAGIYNDIRPSTFLFVFGEGVAEKYKEIGKEYHTQIIPIGSSSLDALYSNRSRQPSKLNIKLQLKPDRKVVLYVTNLFYQNSLYTGWPPMFSDNHFWQTQKSIIDLLQTHKNYNFIVKTHGNVNYRETPLCSYASDRGFTECQFVRNECTFSDLLPLADIVIIDIPSTTVLQSITTIKPIFAYLGHLTIDEGARKLLEKRVYCFDELKQFINGVDTFLSTMSMDKKVDFNNNEFLMKYGMYKQDGKSIIRAVQTILKNVGDD